MTQNDPGHNDFKSRICLMNVKYWYDHDDFDTQLAWN